jgi:hypothetical protein
MNKSRRLDKEKWYNMEDWMISVKNVEFKRIAE